MRQGCLFSGLLFLPISLSVIAAHFVIKHTTKSGCKARVERKAEHACRHGRAIASSATSAHKNSTSFQRCSPTPSEPFTPSSLMPRLLLNPLPLDQSAPPGYRQEILLEAVFVA